MTIEQQIDLDEHVRLTITCEHPSVEDPDERLEELCSSEHSLDMVTFPELSYLEMAARHAPDDIKNDFDSSIIESVPHKLEKARYARVILSLRNSILEAIEFPKDVFELNNESESVVEAEAAGASDDEAEIEDDAVAYNPFDDEEDVNIEQQRKEDGLVVTALNVQKAWNERAEIGRCYDRLVATWKANRTEVDLLREQLEAVHEKESARWLARLELQRAAVTVLSLTNQERVFLKKAVEAYDHQAMRLQQAEGLYGTTPEKVAVEAASLYEEVDLEKFIGTGTAQGRATFMAGRIAAHMASHSETGKHVVEAVRHAVTRVTLTRALLLQ